MHLKAADEISRRQREIERLIEENRSLSILRESCLESQRKDLTTSFEKILSQREEVYIHRERQIESKLASLQTIFEKLRDDNLESKAEVRDLRIKLEASFAENVLKGDTIRRLQWTIEDQMLKKEETEDSLKKELQAALLEIKRISASSTDSKTALGRDVEKVQYVELSIARDLLLNLS